MTFMGGLTDVVGVIGKLGDDVAILEVFVVKLALLELVSDFDVDTLDDDDDVFEDFRLEEMDEDLELDDLLEICEFVCCCSCWRHLARRFLNQT